jgi:hypothetical protein
MYGPVIGLNGCVDHLRKQLVGRAARPLPLQSSAEGRCPLRPTSKASNERARRSCPASNLYTPESQVSKRQSLE